MSPSLENTLINQEETPDFPLTDNKPVGAVKSGDPFFGRKGNKLIRLIEFWSANDRLVAIRVQWHGHETIETYGDISEGTESKFLRLMSGETVEHASIWKTKEGDAVAYIELRTNGVQYFGFGTKPDNATPVVQDVGCGYLVAINGTAGKAVDSLGLLFLSSEVKVGGAYNFFMFDTPPSSSNIRPAVAVEQDFWNHTDEVANWDFSRSKTYTSSQDWKRSQTEEFEVDASISGGFLGLEFGGGASWSEPTTKEHGRSWSESDTYTWTLSGNLNPGEGVRVTSYVTEGSATLPFIYGIAMRWEGEIFWIYVPTRGEYKGKLFAKGEVTAKRL